MERESRKYVGFKIRDIPLRFYTKVFVYISHLSQSW